MEHDDGIGYGYWQEWQARWFEAVQTTSKEHPNCHPQTVAQRAYLRQVCQEYDLAQSITNGNLAGYIQHWYPQPPPPIEVTWRAIHEEEVTGIITDQDDPFEGTFLGGTTGSASDPPAVGDQDGKLGYTRQPRQARTHSVSAWMLRHCLLALGRILSLFDPARRNR